MYKIIFLSEKLLILEHFTWAVFEENFVQKKMQKLCDFFDIKAWSSSEKS